MYYMEDNFIDEIMFFILSLQSSLSVYHAHYPVVFLDSQGLNLLAHCSLSHYHWLQHEANTSMTCLDSPTSNEFQALFLIPVAFEMKFDVLFQ